MNDSVVSSVFLPQPGRKRGRVTPPVTVTESPNNVVTKVSVTEKLGSFLSKTSSKPISDFETVGGKVYSVTEPLETVTKGVEEWSEVGNVTVTVGSDSSDGWRSDSDVKDKQNSESSDIRDTLSDIRVSNVSSGVSTGVTRQISVPVKNSTLLHTLVLTGALLSTTPLIDSVSKFPTTLAPPTVIENPIDHVSTTPLPMTNSVPTPSEPTEGWIVVGAPVIFPHSTSPPFGPPDVRQGDRGSLERGDKVGSEIDNVTGSVTRDKDSVTATSDTVDLSWFKVGYSEKDIGESVTARGGKSVTDIPVTVVTTGPNYPPVTSKMSILAPEFVEVGAGAESGGTYSINQTAAVEYLDYEFAANQSSTHLDVGGLSSTLWGLEIQYWILIVAAVVGLGRVKL